MTKASIGCAQPLKYLSLCYIPGVSWVKFKRNIWYMPHCQTPGSIRTHWSEGLHHTIAMVVLPCGIMHKQTDGAQLLITGLFCLTKTIKCSTFTGRLPQADLEEDHPLTIGLSWSAEYYVRDPGEGRGKCCCIPTGCHGRLYLWHRGSANQEGGLWRW